MKTAIFVLISLWMTIAQADSTAVLYQQGSNKEKQLYTMESKNTTDGDIESIHTQYKDLEGNLVVEEKGKVRGNDLIKFEIDHKQLGHQGVIEAKEGKVYFTKTVDGKASTKEEKLQDTLVASPNFQKFVRKNWDALSNGGTVKFRYAVWDRQETVGFELSKTGTEKVDGAEAVTLRMKPSSFIIAALVKPIIFKFAADGSRLLALNGRVAPKKKDGSTYKDLDAEMFYSYAAAEAPAATATAPAPEAAAQPAKKKSKK